MKAFLLISFCCLLFFGCANSKDTKGGQNKSQHQPLSLEESKVLITPTIYYIPVYDQTNLTCADKKVIKDEKGKAIISVCKNVFDDCLMQGTCQIIQGGKKLLLNVGSVVGTERRFSVIKNSFCIYGIGSSKSRTANLKTTCLDPYYSVAADLNIYNVGDVIYIPAAVGLILPDGAIHDGHFIIRDAGGAIKGYGRFDFFTGFAIGRSENPLARLGFADKQTNVFYTVVEDEEAAKVLKMRNFPLLPVK